MNHGKTSMSYEDAGVSVDRGNKLIERIKDLAANTHSRAVMSGLGGFGALYDFSSLGYREPILVSGTDGVGTKIKLAIENNRHSTIGIDLVAMCVNDLLVQGARPLFFLDYFACSRLNVDTASDVIAGIAKGCKLSGCSLVGGETAEMPGMYAENEYDLAGFCVGAVEKGDIIDGSSIVAGDVVIALASSGPHANGYSLIRKLVRDNDVSLDQAIDNRPLIDLLLEPTTIYVEPVLQLMTEIKIKGLAHITGGGLIENIPRILPAGLGAIIDTSSWQMPAIFGWLQQQGNIERDEMYRTFNCGAGMILVAGTEHKQTVLNTLNNLSVMAWEAGHISQRDAQQAAVQLV